MKKLILIALFSVFTFSSCSDDDNNSVDCIALTQDLLDKGTAFSENLDADSCNAYKTSLTTYINSDCGDEATDESSQQILDGLDCNL